MINNVNSLRKRIRKLLNTISYHKNIYYDDNPINKLKEDYIGVDEQCNFLYENINESAGLIGIVSEHGSGKSSLINILVNRWNFFYKYKIVNLLGDTNKKINKEEILKTVLLSVVNNNKYSYYCSLLNPNYKVVSVKTKNIPIKTISIVFGLLFLFGIFNKIIPSLDFLVYDLPEQIKYFLVTIRQNAGLIGFVGLLILASFSRIAYKIPTKNDENKITMDDINDFLRDEISKYDFIVIEELDRIKSIKSEDILLDTLNVLYNLSKETNTTFIISILPEQFDKLDVENIESSLKPFKAILKLEKTTRENYNKILTDLILEKYKDWKKIGIKIDKKEKVTSRGLKTYYDCTNWLWLSKGDNVNIRVLKHRLNDVIGLYMRIKSRFPSVLVNVNTCIAIVYLKSEYSDFYNYLLEECTLENNDIKDNWLKMLIASSQDDETNNEFIEFVKQTVILSEKDSRRIKELLDDIKHLKKNHLIYKNEIYIYNYPKNSTVYSRQEEIIYNCYKDNKEIDLFNDEIIDDIISDSTCIEDAVEYRKTYKNNTIPSNIVYNFPIIKKLYYEILDSIEDKGKMLAQSLYMFNNNNFENIISCIDLLKKNDVNMYKDIIENNYYEIYSCIYNAGLSASEIHIARKRLLVHLNKNDIKMEKLFPINTINIQYEELKSAGLDNKENLSLLSDIQLDQIENDDLIEMINEKCLSSDKVSQILARKDIESRNDIIKNIDMIDGNIIQYIETNIITFETSILLEIINKIDNNEIIEQRIIDGITVENKDIIVKELLNLKNLKNKTKLYFYVIDYNNIDCIPNDSVLELKERDNNIFNILLNNKIKDIKENKTNYELLKKLYIDSELNIYLDPDLKQIIIDKELYKEKPKNMILLSKQKQTRESLLFVLKSKEIDFDEYVDNREYDSYYGVQLDENTIEILYDKYGDKLVEMRYLFWGQNMAKISRYLTKKKKESKPNKNN